MVFIKPPPMHTISEGSMISGEEDDESSMDSLSIGHAGNGHDDDDDDDDEQNSAAAAEEQAPALDQTLAKEETSAVRCLRLIVFLVLAFAAILVSVTVYVYMKRDEEDTFEDQFYDLAYRLVEGFHANAKLRVQVMDMLSLSVTSSAMATDQVWPFVTIPNYEAQATAARSILGSQYTAIYPLVIQELRQPWEEYTQLVENINWVNESVAYQNEFMRVHNRSAAVTRQLLTEFNMDFGQGGSDSHTMTVEPVSNNITNDGTYGSNPQIFRAGDPDNPEDDGPWVNEDEDAPGPFYPMWQISPADETVALQSINYNILDPYYPVAYTEGINVVQSTGGDAVFGGVWNVDETGYINENDDFDDRTVPAAALFYPVFDKIVPDNEPKKVVAVMELDYEFGPFFSSVLPPNANSITCVVSNCNQIFTYQVTGETAVYLGVEDLHDKNFEELMVSTLMTDFQKSSGGTVYNGAPVNEEYCPWELKVYATQELKDEFVTNKPLYYMATILSVFLFTCLTFVLYDWLVEKRQKKVMNTAVKSDKIVAGLFPQSFREALYQEESNKGDDKRERIHHPNNAFSTESAQGFLEEKGKQSSLGGGEPMAKLYSNCTVFFADIAGFTAWSSARSPTQVFKLLETLYGAFDKLAKRHRVFKVETIGDCYVAVTGLPDPQPNHALLMVKFARDCLAKMPPLTRKLEKILGPDTGNLSLRVGLHSGPVVAGILRGEKGRFQLFGDTVNTAARMESNGKPSCIHGSQEIADILASMGKGHWVYTRDEKIVAKGKGELQTYWIRPSSSGDSVGNSSLVASDTSSFEDDAALEIEEAIAAMPGTNADKLEWAEKYQSSISWTVGLLFRELKGLVFERPDTAIWEEHEEVWRDFEMTEMSVKWDSALADSLFELGNSEWQGGDERSPRTIGGNVEEQLRMFVCCLAYQYKDGPFFNFNHACQVLMSADKMIAQLSTTFGDDKKLNAWVKFTLLLSAIICDVDPSSSDGMRTLESPRASDSSITTTNTFYYSFGKTWYLLMDESLFDLRQCLCATKAEFECFHQLLVNLVFGADISNTTVAVQREQRWREAFKTHGSANVHQQAASILEQVSLASQWTHTMQHWENYKKWNTLLHEELADDFQHGRIQLDPSKDWYQHELRLFDTVIIPLTEKLRLTNVLGGTGNELFKYATHNRREWEATQQEEDQDTATAAYGRVEAS